MLLIVFGCVFAKLSHYFLNEELSYCLLSVGKSTMIPVAHVKLLQIFTPLIILSGYFYGDISMINTKFVLCINIKE